MSNVESPAEFVRRMKGDAEAITTEVDSDEPVIAWLAERIEARDRLMREAAAKEAAKRERERIAKLCDEQEQRCLDSWAGWGASTAKELARVIRAMGDSE